MGLGWLFVIKKQEDTEKTEENEEWCKFNGGAGFSSRQTKVRIRETLT